MALAIAALALVMTAGLLAAQPGGWTGAPSGDGGVAVPDAWLLLSDAAFAGLLPGYAFAQSVTQTLNLTAADSVTDTDDLALLGAWDIATFTSGVSTYAAVAAYDEDGVQILDITDPSDITAAGNITDAGTLVLKDAFGIATFESGGSTYAAVTSNDEDGVQILNITDPYAVTAAGNITDDGTNTDELELNGARNIAIFESGGSTYAAVTALSDDGVQILNITDPSSVTAAGSISDDGTNTDGLELNGAQNIAIFESGGSTYAAVTALSDDGVQILNITDPSAITAAGNISDNGTNTDELELNGASGIVIFESGGSTYAAVASSTDNGVQILNITDPSAVTAAGSITDTDDLALLSARDITTFTSGGSAYAAVTSNLDNGVQILNITDPYAVTAAGSITDTTALELRGAEGITTFTSGGSTYAAVASSTDNGVQILRLTAPPPDAFVTTWETTGANQAITIPATGTYSIDWGDGTVNATASGTQTHTYADAGNYMVAITGGLESININSLPSQAEKDKLRSIDQWGNITWTTMEGAFRGASNMAYDAADTPDLSGVASMNSMFRDTSFSANLSGWNVSQVTDTSRVFQGSSFNDDISGWDVSQVTTMEGMFFDADSFDQPLDTWNVSQVTSMAYMFSGASSFDQTLNDWNVSQVQDMRDMFSASSFNQPLNDWNVSRVQSMRNMFFGASSFDQPLNDWNVSSVTDMTSMFTDAAAFDQNLGDWYVVLDSHSIDLASGTTIGTISPQNVWLADNQNGAYSIGTGGDSGSFEIDGTSLKAKAGEDYAAKTDYVVNITSTHPFGANNHRLVNVTVTDTSTAFKTTWNTATPNEGITIPATGTYSIDWGDGTAESVTGPKTHTYADAGSHTVSITGGLESISINSLPSQAEKDKLRSIDQWGNITWTTMADAFRGASNMAYDAADTPDLSGVASMNSMFRDTSFSANLSGWNVSQVTDTSRIFQGSSFNGDISGWDVSRVKVMRSMFSGASSFNQPLGTWNVSSATNMAYMFYGADRFNQDLGSWNVSSVETVEYMFGSSTSNSVFNGNISTWDVSQVTNMEGMFERASSFNGNLSGWNVSSVTNMDSMFEHAASFNRPLDTWNVSLVTNMNSMFFGATDFEQNLGTWYVVLNSTEIDAADAPGVVGTISAQNMILRGQATYGIGAGGDLTSFDITGGSDLNMTVSSPTKPLYTVNITSAGSFGTNNHRVLRRDGDRHRGDQQRPRCGGGRRPDSRRGGHGDPLRHRLGF